MSLSQRLVAQPTRLLSVNMHCIVSMRRAAGKRNRFQFSITNAWGRDTKEGCVRLILAARTPKRLQRWLSPLALAAWTML